MVLSRLNVEDVRNEARYALATNFPEDEDTLFIDILDGHAVLADEMPPDYDAPWVHRPEEEEYARVGGLRLCEGEPD